MAWRYLVLVLAVLVALWRNGTPQPQPVDAPAAVFSASRAMSDVEAIAQRPHPVGSRDHARVRDYLLSRLTALGLSPLVQVGRATSEGYPGRVVSVPVTNIAAVLKGQDSSQPALLVMSHYDTAPNSPGAADDTAGVAASLEIARALKAGERPARDVIFLFTDGEELGLVGASYFFHEHPLAGHVGAVINFEARGASGPANMFETGPNNAATVAAWARLTPRPSANALSRAIYRRMPNGTDFSLAGQRGLPGLNIAFIGDEAAYHSPLATPARLNRGSLQQMGDEGLAGARAFAEAIPAQEADAVYFDILGFFLVQYGLDTGWVLLGLAGALVLAAIIVAQAVSVFSWGRGLVALLAALVFPAVLLGAAGLPYGSGDHFLRLAHIGYGLAGVAALALGGALWGAGLFGKRVVAVWQWAMLLNLGLAALAQAFMPEVAYVLVWPLLIAAVIALLRFTVWRGQDGVGAGLAASALALVAVAEAAAMGIAMFTALGNDMPVVVLVPLLAILPVLLVVPERASLRSLAVAVVVLGIGLFGYGRLAAATPETPAPSVIRYVADLTEAKAYRVDGLGSADAWTKEVLGEARHEALPWSDGARSWWAPAALVPVPKTVLSVVREGTLLKVTVKPQPGAIFAALIVDGDHALTDAMLDGQSLSVQRRQQLYVFQPGPEGLVWTVTAPKTGTLAFTVKTLYPGWPQGAGALPALPQNKMAFEYHATTETILRQSWKP